uniref:SAM-dependent MTase TRM10-type domain-containing protein n=1 Tax=Strigamia maritima TaxID=126957 RepID=T1J7B5_STRMM
MGVSRNYGAYLQDDWGTIQKMISEASAHLKVPVSCKIRILQDPIKTIEYIRMLENSGCKLVAVHGRTREQKGPLTGLADWKMIEEIAKSVSVPVIANGNILCYDDVIQCLESTGADGSDICPMGLDVGVDTKSKDRASRVTSLPRYKDLQLTLAESNDMATFRGLCSQLKDRCELDMDTAYKQQENKSNAWERPLWLCHSRPRVVCEEQTACTESIPIIRNDSLSENLEKIDLSNKDLKKQKRLLKITEGKKIKRQMQKEKKKNRKIAEVDIQDDSKMKSDHVSKRIVKQMEKERLAAAMKSCDTPRVCIDLGFSYLMNDKELDKLGAQLRRVYGSNRSSMNPLCIYFTNFSQDDALYKACMSKNDGFDKYLIEMRECSHVDLFPVDDIVYLTSDSPNVLTHLNRSKVYVVGGLIDETLHKFITKAS